MNVPMSALRRDVASDDEEYLSGEEGEVDFSDSSEAESDNVRQTPSRSSEHSTQSKADPADVAARQQRPGAFPALLFCSGPVALPG